MRDKDVGLQIKKLNNIIMRNIEKDINGQSLESITGNNGWILGFLSRNEDRDVYQRDLENAFEITRSTASKVIKLMEQKELIKRVSVESDGRLKKLIMTEKGREVFEIIKQNSKKIEKKLTNGFSQEELNTLNDYLQRMKSNMK